MQNLKRKIIDGLKTAGKVGAVVIPLTLAGCLGFEDDYGYEQTQIENGVKQEMINRLGEMYQLRLKLVDSGVMDSNGDGVISETEYEQFLRDMGYKGWRIPTITELHYEELIMVTSGISPSYELSHFARLRG